MHNYSPENANTLSPEVQAAVNEQAAQWNADSDVTNNDERTTPTPRDLFGGTSTTPEISSTMENSAEAPVVQEAKEALGFFGKINIRIKETFSNIAKARIEKRADKDLSKMERREAAQTKKLEAMQRKLARKESHANSAAHEIVRKSRDEKLSHLRQQVSEQTAKVEGITTNITERTDQKETDVDANKAALNKKAEDLLAKRKDKLADKELKKDLKERGYTRKERAVVMESLSEKNRRELGNIALTGVRLDSIEQGAVNDHAAVEQQLSYITHRSNYLYDQLEQTDGDIGDTLVQIESLEAESAKLREQLPEYGGVAPAINGETSLFDLRANMESTTESLAQKQRHLEETKRRREHLQKEYQDVGEQLHIAEQETQKSSILLDTKRATLTARRNKLATELEAVHNAIQNGS